MSLATMVVVFGAAFWMRVGAQPPDRTGSAPADREREITAAEGFTVEEVYSPEQSGSVIMFTFDSDGHLVIAREQDAVVRLIDTNDDGRPDEEQVVTDQVTNAQGLLFDGDVLLAVGDGPEGTGLYRVTASDGDDTAADVELITESTSEIQEHGPHTVFFGPDGFLYWMLGNHTRIVPSTHPLSPHRGWIEGQLLPSYTDARGHAAAIRAPGGTVIRRDLHDTEADWEDVAGGFRNAYDAAFNLMGELIAFDSDMEWDLGMPWFRPVRTNHVVPGGEYGWRTGSGKWPDYYPDSLPGMTDVGRGSPVGVVFYQSGAYPEAYHDAVLHGDWSRGRILLGTLEKAGATYTDTLTDFVVGTPLNVTGVDVGPDGHVYFTKGGRKTEGGIYRVVHEQAGASPQPDTSTPVARALAQWQPRSAWGRAAIAEAQDEAGTAWDDELTEVVTSDAESPDRRVRALELRQVHGQPPDEDLLQSLGNDAAWEVRAASTYYLGLHPTETARRELATRLNDADPFVRRRAAEALVRTGVHPAMDVPFDPVRDLLPLLGDDDRHVRYAARELLQRVNRNRWQAAALTADTFPAATEALLALVKTTQSVFDVEPLLARQAELLDVGVPEAHLPAFLRVVHLAMIQDEGVSFSTIYGEMAERLRPAFPSSDSATNREIARTLAYVGGSEAVEAIVAQLSDPGTDREDQLFYMYCLRAMEDGGNASARDLVVQWFKKTQDEQWRGGASFIGFLELMWNDFVEMLPEAEREAAREAVGSFRPETTRLEDERRNDTARFSEQELTEYLLWDPMAYTGDPERGAEMYEKALCASCHRFGDHGFDVGPDLTDVARRFERADVLEKILYPSKTISDQWAPVQVVTQDEQSIVGVVSAETADTLTLQPANGAAVQISKREIVSRQRSEVSVMPEGLLNALSLREIADLFAFLEDPPH